MKPWQSPAPNEFPTHPARRKDDLKSAGVPSLHPWLHTATRWTTQWPGLQRPGCKTWNTVTLQCAPRLCSPRLPLRQCIVVHVSSLSHRYTRHRTSLPTEIHGQIVQPTTPPLARRQSRSRHCPTHSSPQRYPTPSVIRPRCPAEYQCCSAPLPPPSLCSLSSTSRPPSRRP